MSASWKLKMFIMLARLTVVFSIFGCVYQIVDITIEYFEKETVTEIKIMNPDNVTVPAISLCTRLPFLVDFEKLVHLHPNLVNVIQDNYSWVNSTDTYAHLMKSSYGYEFVFEHLTNLLKLNDIRDVLYTWDDIVSDLYLNGHNMFGYLDKSMASEYCGVNLYAMDLNACFRFDCTKKGVYVITSKDLMRSDLKEDLVTFFVNQSIFSRIQHFNIYLHSPNTYTRGQHSPTVIIKSTKQSSLYYVTYKRYETTRMPSPYASDCMNYKKIGYESRFDAINHCENKLSLQELNAPLYGASHSFRYNKSHGFRFYFTKYLNDTFQDIVYKIQDICGERYHQPNCKEEYFIPKSLTPRKYIGGTTQIIISWPTEPDIILLSKAKLPFSEYIILLESIFGTWFGFCFAGSLPELYRWALKTPKVKYRIVDVKKLKKMKQKQLNVHIY